MNSGIFSVFFEEKCRMACTFHLFCVFDSFLVGHGHLLGEFDHYDGLVTDNLSQVPRFALVSLPCSNCSLSSIFVGNLEGSLLKVAKVASRAFLRLGIDGKVRADALSPLPSRFALDAHSHLVTNVNLLDFGLWHFSKTTSAPIYEEMRSSERTYERDVRSFI